MSDATLSRRGTHLPPALRREHLVAQPEVDPNAGIQEGVPHIATAMRIGSFHWFTLLMLHLTRSVIFPWAVCTYAIFAVLITFRMIGCKYGSQDAFYQSVHCPAAISTVCAYPGLHVFFPGSCHGSSDEATAVDWDSYLHVLRLHGDLIATVSDQLLEHPLSTLSLQHVADAILRQSEDLPIHSHNPSVHIPDASATFWNRTSEYSLGALSLYDDAVIVAQDAFSAHTMLAGSLAIIDAPLLNRVPYLLPGRNWMTAHMYKSACLALRIMGGHLLDRYEETLSLLEEVAAELENLRVGAVTFCSPSALGHLPLLQMPTGYSADSVTACRRFIHRLNSARYEVAACASPLLETRKWLLGVGTEVEDAACMAAEHSNISIDAADTTPIYELVTYLASMIDRMQHSITLRALRDNVLSGSIA